LGALQTRCALRVLPRRDPGVESLLGHRDGELATVAGQDAGGTRQRQYLGTDCVQLAAPVRIAVRAGHRTGLADDIAGEYGVELAAEEADRAPAVPRSVQHLQPDAADLEHATVFHVDVRRAVVHITPGLAVRRVQCHRRL